MDEIFGAQNFVACIANVNNPKGRSDDKYIATAHEYLIIYKRSDHISLRGWKPDEVITKRYNKVDKLGLKYREIDLRKTGDNDRKEDRENLFYSFYYNKTTQHFFASREDTEKIGYIRIVPLRDDGSFGNWRWKEETANTNITALLPKMMPVRKVWTVFERDYFVPGECVKPTSAWTKKEFNTERATESFVDLGFTKNDFPRTKPVGLIKAILEIATDKDSLVLDSFAGSGTTGHAVLDLNREDGGNRRFILVEMEDAIAREVTAERLRRVIARAKPTPQAVPTDTGDGLFAAETATEEEAAAPAAESSGEGFTFYTLGLPVIGEDGATPPGVPDALLARHIFYTETQARPPDALDLPLIGVHETVAYYLLRGDYSDDTDAGLPAHSGVRVVFADTISRSEAALKAGNVQAKHLPYDIKRG